MAGELNFQGGRKLDAASVYDVTQAKGQDALNAVTAALDALKVAANNNKALGIVGGAFGAVAIPRTAVAFVALSGTWNGSGPYTQTVTITGYTITANSKVDLDPDAAAISALAAAGVQALYIVNNTAVLTAYAVGAAPTAALTIQCTITEVVT